MELKEKKFEFTYKGVNYELDEPNYRDLKHMQKQIKEDPENPDILINFLEKIGLERDVSETMGISVLLKISEEVSGAKKN